jgi:thiazole synthase
MDELVIAGRTFKSRLLIGTGKFSSNQAMLEAMEASGSDIVTVALRRVDIDNPEDYMLKHIDRHKYLQLPTPAAPATARRRCAWPPVPRRRLRAVDQAGGHPRPLLLLPDPIETYKAAQILVKDGFTVLPTSTPTRSWPSISEEIGCATVMPRVPHRHQQGGADPGQNRHHHRAGPSSRGRGRRAGRSFPRREAMEMGADAVLVNTALAVSPTPGMMAAAFKKGVEAGRAAFLAGLGKQRKFAEASSPLTGFLRNEK